HERNRGDRQLRQRPDDEGPDALPLELAEFRLQTHAGEREQERPARQVRERGDLYLVEDLERRQQRDEEESQDELGKLLPEERSLALHRLRLTAGGPVDCVR